MARIVEQLKAHGAAVGIDDVVKAAAYGTAGVSGHPARRGHDPEQRQRSGP